MLKSKLTLFSLLIIAMFFSGCVERKLTIYTKPAGAIVELNDEQIGTSPVTVGFNWYGDYNVIIKKQGYKTLKTHRVLKGPWYDKFPFDFIAQVLSSKRIVDSYQWNFELTKQPPIERDKLIESALELKKQL